MNTEEMKQQDILLSAVVRLVEENEEWRGTPPELQKALCLAPNPRALAVQINKLRVKLEKHGIFVKHVIGNGRYTIKIISNSQKRR